MSIRSSTEIVSDCKQILKAYKDGKLGYTSMPEESSPIFSESEKEQRLIYFTLPMSLNYQRDSYKLWISALKTYNDPETRIIFDIKSSSLLEEAKLRKYLLRYKLALQPNKHIATWKRISQTIAENWGTIGKLIESSDYDFLKLRDIIQKQFKSEFPYLSGPKIFNYWSFIIQEYGKTKLLNSELIDIAPDTHITKCSVILGVISEKEAQTISKEEISNKWREILKRSGINPIQMHPPLWFWSKNNFKYKLKHFTRTKTESN